MEQVAAICAVSTIIVCSVSKYVNIRSPYSGRKIRRNTEECGWLEPLKVFDGLPLSLHLDWAYLSGYGECQTSKSKKMSCLPIPQLSMVSELGIFSKMESYMGLLNFPYLENYMGKLANLIHRYLVIRHRIEWMKEK